MKTNNENSILFISPDYHCSFAYRDELRRLGWKADIFVPPGYPADMLFGKPDLKIPNFRRIKFFGKYLENIAVPILFLLIFRRYKFHFYYCGLDHFHFLEKKLGVSRIFGDTFRFHLWLAKKFKRIVIHLPSGLPDEAMPEIVAKYGNDEEHVHTEDSKHMKIWFDVLRKYADFIVGTGLYDPTQYKAVHFKYKVIDLELFNPAIQVPEELKLAPTKKLRIMHSFMFEKDRVDKYKGNIKGTKYIEEAVERLIAEGHELEYMYFDNIPANLFRFYQIQADIVVEEIIRGGWGSTALECIALGKPVITYVRPEWEAFYYECFPDTRPLPIFNANKHTIYDVLKTVVADADLRSHKSVEARRWAVAHLNPTANVRDFVKVLDTF